MGVIAYFLICNPCANLIANGEWNEEWNGPAPEISADMHVDRPLESECWGMCETCRSYGEVVAVAVRMGYVDGYRSCRCCGTTQVSGVICDACLAHCVGDENTHAAHEAGAWHCASWCEIATCDSSACDRYVSIDEPYADNSETDATVRAGEPINDSEARTIAASLASPGWSGQIFTDLHQGRDVPRQELIDSCRMIDGDDDGNMFVAAIKEWALAK